MDKKVVVFNFWYALLIFIILIAALFLFRFIRDPIFDEIVYYFYSKSLSNGSIDSVSYELTPMLPGYVVFLGYIGGKILGLSSILELRLFSMVVFIPLFFTVVYHLYKTLDGKIDDVRVFQNFTLPILFPYIFLIYTDSLSLLTLFACLLLILKKKYFWASLLGFFCVMLRQNNIIWLFFFYLIATFNIYGLDFDVNKLSLKDIKKITFKYNIMLKYMLIPLTPVILNIFNSNSFALGDKSSHPFRFDVNNLYFAIITFGFLFIPIFVNNIKSIARLILIHKYFLILVLAIIFYFYWIYFMPVHKYNFLDGYLRNEILMAIHFDIQAKLILFVYFIVGFLTLMTTKFQEKIYYLMYLFGILFLAPLFLIEHRYYIIPMSLFLLFRKSMPVKYEVSLAVWFMIINIFSLYIISKGFFL